MRRRPNILLGVICGALMASGLSVIVLLSYAIGGPGVVAEYGVSLGSVLAIYWGIGITGGIVFGLMLPITVWRWGAVLVGAICGVSFYMTISWVVRNEFDVFGSMVIGALVGGAVGYGLWTPVKPDSAATRE